MYRVITDYLTPNKYSRPQIPLKTVKKIVIHWVANKNTTAKANRRYFEDKAHGSNTGYGSSHDIIDLNGDVLVIIPDNELSYGCDNNSYYYTTELSKELGYYPNDYIYNIECTHVDDTGLMSLKTYKTLIERVSDLCVKYKLNPLTDIILHNHVTGKNCHKWFVDNPNEFTFLKERVGEYMREKLGQITEEWKIKLGTDSINHLVNNGLIDSPEMHIDNLNKLSIEPYLFWTMLDRLIKYINENNENND